MKKSILFIVMVAASFSIISGCAEDNTLPDSSQSQHASAEISEAQLAIQPEPVASGTIGAYAINVVGTETFEDIGGNSAIRIYYDFTNRSDETIHAGALTYEASQNGVQLSNAFPPHDAEARESENVWLDIRPGVTIRCLAEFEYDPSINQLTFTAKGQNTAEEVSIELNTNALPGRPETYDHISIPSPQWVSNLPSSGPVNDDGSEVEILDSAFMADEDGEKTVRVIVEFTNNSEHIATFYSSTYLRVMQDGIELKTAPNVQSAADEQSLYTEVDSGETITVAFSRTLISENPVEVEFYDGWTHNALVGVVLTPVYSDGEIKDS